MRCCNCLAWASCFIYTFQQGQPPLLPSVYNMEVVEVSSIGVLLKSKLDWTKKTWRPCTTISREVKTNFQQERSSPWISRNLVLKRHHLSNQTPRASGCLTMRTHVPWLLWLQMSTNPHVGAVKKYFVKIYKNQSNQKNQKSKKLDESRTWKGDLGKYERLSGLKTQKCGPSKN